MMMLDTLARKDEGAAATAPRVLSQSQNRKNQFSPSWKDHEGCMSEQSYPKNGTGVLPVTNGGLSEQVSTAIIAFPAKAVAAHANRTPEAAKKWKAGDACPDLASAINMARGIPVIKWLIYQEIEKGCPDGVFSPQLVVKALALLTQIADGSSEHAAMARAILSNRGADE